MYRAEVVFPGRRVDATRPTTASRRSTSSGRCDRGRRVGNLDAAAGRGPTNRGMSIPLGALGIARCAGVLAALLAAARPDGGSSSKPAEA